MIDILILIVVIMTCVSIRGSTYEERKALIIEELKIKAAWEAKRKEK